MISIITSLAVVLTVSQAYTMEAVHAVSLQDLGPLTALKHFGTGRSHTHQQKQQQLHHGLVG